MIITNMPTIPVYNIIIKNENPIRIGKSTMNKIKAKKIKQAGTPKIYQYNNAFIFVGLSPYIFSTPQTTIS